MKFKFWWRIPWRFSKDLGDCWGFLRIADEISRILWRFFKDFRWISKDVGEFRGFWRIFWQFFKDFKFNFEGSWRMLRILKDLWRYSNYSWGILDHCWRSCRIHEAFSLVADPPMLSGFFSWCLFCFVLFFQNPCRSIRKDDQDWRGSCGILYDFFKRCFKTLLVLLKGTSLNWPIKEEQSNGGRRSLS